MSLEAREDLDPIETANEHQLLVQLCPIAKPFGQKHPPLTIGSQIFGLTKEISLQLVEFWRATFKAPQLVVDPIPLGLGVDPQARRGTGGNDETLAIGSRIDPRPQTRRDDDTSLVVESEFELALEMHRHENLRLGFHGPG